MKNNHKYWYRFVACIYDAVAKKISNSDAVIIILRYNAFIQTYNFIKRSQWWSKEKIIEHQLKKLQKLIKHSYENIPYYRDLFDKNGIKPEDIINLKDLQKIPFLTKEIIRKNIDTLKSQNYPNYRFQYTATSGSTGKPLGLYVDKINHPINTYAFYKINLKRAGCRIYDKSVDLRGAINIPSADKGKFWKYSILERTLSLSTFHLTEGNMPKYIEKIRKFKPKYILVYPSTITEIARYVEKNDIKPITSLKIIFCTAEVLYEWQRRLLNKVFQCKIFETYGHSEDTAIAGSCEKSKNYHFFPEYGIVELIGKDGMSVTKEGEKGEIVTTGFMNELFPLIRYRTEDIGVFTDKKCTCGRNCVILKNIEGKWQQEYIYTKDDRPISFTTLDINFSVFNNVKQFQFHQKEKGVITLRILKGNLYSNVDTKVIRQELVRLLGNGIELKIGFVNDIQKTKTGKYSYLIQELPKSC